MANHFSICIKFPKEKIIFKHLNYFNTNRAGIVYKFFNSMILFKNDVYFGKYKLPQ